MSSETTPAAEIVALLAKHEYRWTTHGNVRLYDVIHCAGDCDWSLRQKALMSDDYVIEKHREHVAEQIAALLNPDHNPESAEVARLRKQVDTLANLAAEHLNCTGCPTPWWLTNWLVAVAAEAPVEPNNPPVSQTSDGPR